MQKNNDLCKKNDHINFGNGTLQCRKMTNIRYAKFFKLRKLNLYYYIIDYIII